MEDSAFLQQSLEKSFYLPEFQSSDNVEAVVKPFAEGFFFNEKYCKTLSPIFLSQKQIKKYTDLIKGDIEHNPQLEEEYILYKHDVEENIIIPKDFTPAMEFIVKYDLREVNRKNARKKKVIATVFPANFRPDFAIIAKEHRCDITEAQNIFKQYKTTAELSVLKDFTLLYRQTLKQTDFKHFSLWLNRKRFRFYLNEAAQILKSDCPLADDFSQSHAFWGGKLSRFCTFRLEQMLEQLKKLSENKELLNLVQLLLAKPQNYLSEVNRYKTNQKISNLSVIHSLRQTTQNLSSKYALLNYFNAALRAFEYDFLDKCPAAKHPPLPTVSPQNELQEIKKIISESFKINSSQNHLNRLCVQLLKDYENSRKDFLQKLKPLLTQK